MNASSRDEAASKILRRTFAVDRGEAHNETRLSALYAEFAHDERRLAEEGIEDYDSSLVEEDAR